MERILKNIIALMEHKNIKAQQLADAIGTTNQQIYRLLNGERGLTIKWLERISAGLGVTLEALMGGYIPDTKETEAVIARAGTIIEKLSTEMDLDWRAENKALGEVFIQYDAIRSSGNTLSDSEIERIAMTVFRLGRS